MDLDAMLLIIIVFAFSAFLIGTALNNAYASTPSGDMKLLLTGFAIFFVVMVGLFMINVGVAKRKR